MADAAAKDATNNRPIPMPIPATDFRRKIDLNIQKKWQSYWDLKRNNKLHSIQPTISKYKHANRKSRREEIILTRLRIGHTRLTHVYIIKKDAQYAQGVKSTSRSNTFS